MSASARPEVNAASIEVAPHRGSPAGFQARYRQLGPLLGAELLGGTVYEFDPGERTGPYHYEIGNESSAVARVLILSTMRVPFGCAYPDRGKVSTFAGLFPIGTAADYWDGESA